MSDECSALEMDAGVEYTKILYALRAQQILDIAWQRFYMQLKQRWPVTECTGRSLSLHLYSVILHRHQSSSIISAISISSSYEKRTTTLDSSFLLSDQFHYVSFLLRCRRLLQFTTHNHTNRFILRSKNVQQQVRQRKVEIA